MDPAIIRLNSTANPPSTTPLIVPRLGFPILDDVGPTF